MKTNRVFSIVLVFTLCLASIPYQAQAQQPVTQSNPRSGSARSGDETQLSNLVAQARPQRRAGFALMTGSYAANLSGPVFSITPAAAGPNLTVLGSGTVGRLTKWTGFTSSNSFIGDSTIFESKSGLVGIGTDTPTSKLTVAGTIESTSGGLKFPDGTLQTTAGIAPTNVVRSLNGLKGDVQLTAGSNITITPAGNTLTVGIASPLEVQDVSKTSALADQFDGTQASPLGVASPLEVRDLDNPARHAIQADAVCQFFGTGLCDAMILEVPMGKRLVIEYVSMDATGISVGEVAFFEIQTTLNGKTVFYRLPMSPPAVAQGQNARITMAQQVRIYADEGTDVHGSWTNPLGLVRLGT